MKPKKLHYKDFLERDEIAPQATQYLKLIGRTVLLFLGITIFFLILGSFLGNVFLFLQIGLIISLFILPLFTVLMVLKREK